MKQQTKAQRAVDIHIGPLTGRKLETPITPGSIEHLSVLSASKMPQLMNLCPPEWGDEFTLWHEMRHKRQLSKPSDAMTRGHEFEPMIRDWFQRDHPTLRVETTSTWAHLERPWQTADPDGEVWHDDGTLELLEVKTASDMRDWGQPGTDEIPDHYYAQTQWQLDTIGARRVHVAVCGPFELFDRKPRYYIIDYDPEYARVLREKGLRFMQSLELGVEPVRRNTTDKAMLAVRWKNPVITDDPGLEIPDEIAEPYLATRGDCPTCAEAKDAAATLLEYMGSAKKATYRGVTIANRVNGRAGAPPMLRAAKGIALKTTA